MSSAARAENPLTIVVKKSDAQIFKSDPWTFTEGKISGTYTGTLNYYTHFLPDGVTPDAANSYDYRATLTQYGTLVVATDIVYLYDSNGDHVNDKEEKQTCAVVMTTSTVSGKIKLTGTGNYTNKSGTTVTKYSGEASVFGDARTISCDAYWLSTDTAKKSWGSFESKLKGTSSISGKVTINKNGQTPIFVSTDPADEDTCYTAVLYGFGESNMKNNAGQMYMGPVETSGADYFFTYKIDDLPAGSYYLMFGGIDGETGTPEAERDHMPWSKGEAVGLYGLNDPGIAVKWIDGITLTGTDKTAFDALVPVTVKEGEVVTGRDISAIVRAANK